jgi:integrase
MRKTLKKVSSNLYRHTGNKAYWGSKKIAGKAQWHPLDTTDPLLAKNLLADWLRDIEETDPQIARDTTMGMMLDRFLATRAGQKAATVRNEVSIANLIRRSFKPGMGILIVRVKTSDLQTYLVEQAAKNDWKGRTFNRHRLFLAQLFSMAVADHLFNESSNPFKPKIIKRRKNDKVFRHIPTPEQFEAIINNIRGLAEKQVMPGAKKHGGVRGRVHGAIESANFLEFLGLAGVGQAEASAMRWEDVDFKTERIHFVRQKTSAQFSLPMYAWLKPLMLRMRTANSGTGPVFTIRDCGKALEGACHRLDLPHFSQRNLRAMLIKRLHDGGLSHKRIAEWQGHRDGGKLILETYTEVFADSDASSEQADLERMARVVIPFTPKSAAA